MNQNVVTLGTRNGCGYDGVCVWNDSHWVLVSSVYVCEWVSWTTVRKGYICWLLMGNGILTMGYGRTTCDAHLSEFQYSLYIFMYICRYFMPGEVR